MTHAHTKAGRTVYFKAGYASAMVFFAFVLTLTLAQFGLLERRVHYR